LADFLLEHTMRDIWRIVGVAVANDTVACSEDIESATSVGSDFGDDRLVQLSRVVVLASYEWEPKKIDP